MDPEYMKLLQQLFAGTGAGGGNDPLAAISNLFGNGGGGQSAASATSDALTGLQSGAAGAVQNASEQSNAMIAALGGLGGVGGTSPNAQGPGGAAPDYMTIPDIRMSDAAFLSMMTGGLQGGARYDANGAPTALQNQINNSNAAATPGAGTGIAAANANPSGYGDQLNDIDFLNGGGGAGGGTPMIDPPDPDADAKNAAWQKMMDEYKKTASGFGQQMQAMQANYQDMLKQQQAQYAAEKEATRLDAMNKGQAKRDPKTMVARSKANNINYASQGIGSTNLTGVAGVDQSKLTLGKNALLGA